MNRHFLKKKSKKLNLFFYHQPNHEEYKEVSCHEKIKLILKQNDCFFNNNNNFEKGNARIRNKYILSNKISKRQKKKREREKKRNQGLLHTYTKKKNSQRRYYPGSLLHVPHNEAPFTSAWFLRGEGREGVDSRRKIDTRTRSELRALPRSISESRIYLCKTFTFH